MIKKKETLNVTFAAGVIVVILALFLVMVLIPQNFWVNLSMKFFK